MFKKIRTLIDECPICEDEKSLIYGDKKESITVRGEKISVDTKAYYCKNGKHYFYDPNDEEKKFQDVYREYRELKGLLQPEEVTAIREKYGLSRKAFARFLGWGEITIQRYETGAIPDLGYNNMLLMIQKTSNFEDMFEIRKKYLSPKDITRINLNLAKLNQLSFEYIFNECAGSDITDDVFIEVFSRLSDLNYIAGGSIDVFSSDKELAIAS